MRRVSARVDLQSTEEGMGSRLRLHGGAGSSREKRGGRGSVLGGEIPRLRFAALRMTCWKGVTCRGDDGGRMGSRPRLHEGRLRVGTTDVEGGNNEKGWGVRLGTEKGGFDGEMLGG